MRTHPAATAGCVLISPGASGEALERPPCRDPPRACECGGGQGGPFSVLAGGVGQQTLVDLAERDRQRLLLGSGVDQRADILQQALGELAVVGVDLART